MRDIISLRGVLIWVAHAREAYRPFIASLFALGAANPARKHLLAWEQCPREAEGDLLA